MLVLAFKDHPQFSAFGGQAEDSGGGEGANGAASSLERRRIVPSSKVFIEGTIMVSRANQQSHDAMVRRVRNHLQSHLFTDIKADLPGDEQPLLLYWQATGKGHIPDVTGKYGSVTYIFEIETEDTIKSEHTRDQLILFSANAKQYGKKLVVVVPAGWSGVTKGQLALWRIDADVWEA